MIQKVVLTFFIIIAVYSSMAQDSCGSITRPRPQKPIIDSVFDCDNTSIKTIIAQPFSTNDTITWYSDISLNNKLYTGLQYNPSTTIGVNHFYVTETAVNGCVSAIQNAIVIVSELPNAIVNPVPLEVPLGVKVKISGYASLSFGKAPYTAIWLPSENIESTSGFSALTKAIVVSPSTYSLVITDANGCISTSSISFDIGSSLDFKIVEDSIPKTINSNNMVDTSNIYTSNSLNYKGFDNICLGDSINLLSFISGSGSGNYSYKWTSNNDPFYIQTTPNITVKPIQSTIYTLTITDNNSIILPSKSFHVNVFQNPVPYFVISKNSDSLFTNQSITFTGSKGSDLINYNWKVNGTAECNPPSNFTTIFKANNPGDYTITYTVSDNNGCLGFISKTLTVFMKDTINSINNATSYCNNISNTLLPYPNPASQQLHITSHFERNTDGKIKLFNINGTLLYEKTLTSISFVDETISISSLPEGIYTVVLETTHDAVSALISIIK